MPDASARRVLLCGGPLAGHWVGNVPECQSDIRTFDPPPVAMSPSESHPALFPEAVYAIRPLELDLRALGARQVLWVGQLVRAQPRDQREAVIAALFQRNVAQHLLGQR